MKQLLIKIWHYTPMILILFISSATYFSVQNYLEPTKNQIYKTFHEPIYRMVNVEFNDISLDKDNKYKIKANEALQYEDDKTFALHKIQITNSEPQKQSTLKSESGTINNDFSQIDLKQAYIEQKDIKSNTIITSDNMIFFPKQDIVKTTSRTIVQQQNQGKTNILESDKITFNNINRNLELDGKIFGIINPTNN